MFKGTKVIGVIFQNGARRHRDVLDGISMVGEYDGAFFEGRKNIARHPLDGNRLQTQDTKCLDYREVNPW